MINLFLSIISIYIIFTYFIIVLDFRHIIYW